MVSPRRAQEDHAHNDIIAPGTATGTRFWRGDGSWVEPPAGDDDNVHYLGRSLYQWVRDSNFGIGSGSSSSPSAQTVWTTTGTALQKLPITRYGISLGTSSYHYSSTNRPFHTDYTWAYRVIGGLWKFSGNGKDASSEAFFGLSASTSTPSVFGSAHHSVGFRFTAGQANWHAVTCNGSSVTEQDSGVPVVVDEPYSFEFMHEAGEVRMLIRNLFTGDSYDTTISTTMPTQAMGHHNFVSSPGTSQDSYCAVSTYQGVVDWESGL